MATVAPTLSRLFGLEANSFLRKVALLSGGSAAGHLFTLAVSPVLTRMFGPEDFGTLGLFTSFLAVSGVAVALQYETCIVSASDQSEAAYVALGAAMLAVPTSVTAGLVLWFLIHFSLLGFARLPLYVPVALSCVMCFVGLFAILRYWSLREQNFREVSKAVFVQNAARAALQVAAGWLGLHNAGLIIGETLGRGVGMGRMFRSSWPELGGYARNFRWSECKRVLRKYWKFPLLSFPSALIDALCVSLAVPLLIQEYGPRSGGSYALVWRVLSLPSVLITLAVADTFHTQIAEHVRERPSRVLAFFLRASVILLFVGTVPAVILLLWARPLFVLVLGRQWDVSGAMAAIIVPWFLIQFVVNPLSRTVLVLSGQETKLIWDVLCLIAIPAVFYVARVRQLDVLDSVRLLSLTNAFLYLVYFAVLLRLIIKFHRSIGEKTAPAPAVERIVG